MSQPESRRRKTGKGNETEKKSQHTQNYWHHGVGAVGVGHCAKVPSWRRYAGMATGQLGVACCPTPYFGIHGDADKYRPKKELDCQIIGMDKLYQIKPAVFADPVFKPESSKSCCSFLCPDIHYRRHFSAIRHLKLSHKALRLAVIKFDLYHSTGFFPAFSR